MTAFYTMAFSLGYKKGFGDMPRKAGSRGATTLQNMAKTSVSRCILLQRMGNLKQTMMKKAQPFGGDTIAFRLEEMAGATQELCEDTLTKY